MKKRIQSLLIAASLATAGASAFAQMDGPMMDHGGMHHMDPEKMAQMHARHLADLKAKLKITPAQEAAWTTFAEAMKPPANLQAQRPDRAELDKLSTPERIDRMRALHKERMAAMEAAMDKRGDATKVFYGTLSPEQKKVFDAEFARMGDRGEHRRHGPMGSPDGASKPTPPAKP